MICSSLNFDRFIVRLLVWSGFYRKLEEDAGLRSVLLARKKAALEFGALARLKSGIMYLFPAG